MTKPTIKQLNAIRFIKNNLGINFEGETLEDASEFIGDFLTSAKEAKEECYDPFMDGDETLWGYDGDAL